MKHAGIVEKHIDLAKSRECFFHRSPAIISEAHVRLNEHRFGARRLDVRNHLGAAFRVTTGYDDRRTFFSETNGRCTADT